jgi:hypothetical protein
MHIFDPCCFSSDLPGLNPATNDKMILYYCLMTKVDRSLAIVRYFSGRVVTIRDDEGARIRAFPRAHRLEGAPHVVFESQ